MPAHNRLWFDNQEDIGPTGPDRPEVVQNPGQKDSKSGRGRSRFSTATCCLRADDLQGGIPSGTEEDAERTQYGEQQLDHEITVYHGPAPD
jgi:hypothetical protein